jgi:CheY-like chemotaxis protein
MPAPHDSLRGLRILLVEDNFLIAEVLRGQLVDWGCEVIGPAGRVQVALELLARAEPDGAILDIDLNGQRCFPVAAALGERAVPFVFLTGYDDPALIPPEFRGVPRLSKPVEQGELVSVAARLFGRTASP